MESEGLISYWVDRMVETGTEWDVRIQQELESSDLIIYLLSPDFIATSYIMEVELIKGIELYEKYIDSDHKVKLNFIQLQPNRWIGDRNLSKFQHLLDPETDGKKVNFITTPDNDEAWMKVIDDLEEIIGD